LLEGERLGWSRGRRGSNRRWHLHFRKNRYGDFTRPERTMTSTTG
jgi:hypothetical protein